MARTAVETANILSSIYGECFGSDSYEPFSISWPQLRTLAGVPRLDDSFIKKISDVLSETDNCLIPFNNFLLIASEQDLSHFRTMPDRLLEKYLPNGDEDTAENNDLDVDDAD
jgi:hypothetical protein